MHMKRFLQEEKLVILLNLVQDQIFIDSKWAIHDY